MNQNSHPLETIIDFAWSAGADRFWVNNAKDELKRLREKNKEWAIETFKANTFAIEQTNEYLAISAEMQKIKDGLANPVAYATINELGDLYDLNVQNNPYKDQTKIVPLYRIN
jgi:hypothetical protein